MRPVSFMHETLSSMHETLSSMHETLSSMHETPSSMHESMSSMQETLSSMHETPSLMRGTGLPCRDEGTSLTDSMIYAFYARTPLTFGNSGPIFPPTQRRRLSHSVRFPSQSPVGSK